MVLNDLELLYVRTFPGISRDFAELGVNSGYTNEDRHVLSATEL